MCVCPLPELERRQPPRLSVDFIKKRNTEKGQNVLLPFVVVPFMGWMHFGRSTIKMGSHKAANDAGQALSKRPISVPDSAPSGMTGVDAAHFSPPRT